MRCLRWRRVPAPALFIGNTLRVFAVVWPPNQWYSGIGFLGIAVTAALAIAAFRIATKSAGARPVRALAQP